MMKQRLPLSLICFTLSLAACGASSGRPVSSQQEAFLNNDATPSNSDLIPLPAVHPNDHPTPATSAVLVDPSHSTTDRSSRAAEHESTRTHQAGIVDGKTTEAQEIASSDKPAAVHADPCATPLHLELIASSVSMSTSAPNAQPFGTPLQALFQVTGGKGPYHWDWASQVTTPPHGCLPGIFFCDTSIQNDTWHHLSSHDAGWNVLFPSTVSAAERANSNRNYFQLQGGFLYHFDPAGFVSGVEDLEITVTDQCHVPQQATIRMTNQITWEKIERLRLKVNYAHAGNGLPSFPFFVFGGPGGRGIASVQPQRPRGCHDDDPQSCVVVVPLEILGGEGTETRDLRLSDIWHIGDVTYNQMDWVVLTDPAAVESTPSSLSICSEYLCAQIQSSEFGNHYRADDTSTMLACKPGVACTSADEDRGMTPTVLTWQPQPAFNLRDYFFHIVEEE